MAFEKTLELLNDSHNINRSSSWRRVYVVGRTVTDAKKQWSNIRSRYPQYKSPRFISHNAANLDGLDPDGMVLVLLTGYLENPIVKNNYFRYLVENASDVKYESEGIT
ncbi:hypothetical protein P8785_06215 [Bacillus subtilis]|uniref:hypothetical protein n=1 Tax=Bacillus subtilis TaxID=1423 RepID=UPI002DBD0652|nr:hypothetical protein [Bacillus subtilis]MEC0395440.1 hypothetical protein [Bacillus subtilis]